MPRWASCARVRSAQASAAVQGMPSERRSRDVPPSGTDDDAGGSGGAPDETDGDIPHSEIRESLAAAKLRLGLHRGGSGTGGRVSPEDLDQVEWLPGLPDAELLGDSAEDSAEDIGDTIGALTALASDANSGAAAAASQRDLSVSRALEMHHAMSLESSHGAALRPGEALGQELFHSTVAHLLGVDFLAEDSFLATHGPLTDKVRRPLCMHEPWRRTDGCCAVRGGCARAWKPGGCRAGERGAVGHGDDAGAGLDGGPRGKHERLYSNRHRRSQHRDLQPTRRVACAECSLQPRAAVRAQQQLIDSPGTLATNQWRHASRPADCVETAAAGRDKTYEGGPAMHEGVRRASTAADVHGAGVAGQNAAPQAHAWGSCMQVCMYACMIT